jgi:hypothetical protein
MKVLNRPMFRYGGPIKEGIMSGIQEPRQGYRLGKNVDRRTPPVLVNMNDQAKAFENIFTTPQVTEQQITEFATPYNAPNIFTPPEPVKNTTDKFITVDRRIPRSNETKTVTVENPDYIQKFKTITTPRGDRKVPIDSGSSGTSIYETFDGSSDKMPPMLSKDMGSEMVKNRVDDVNNNENNNVIDRKEKVNSILEGLGYDRAQKNALYDAMIKAGQRISRTGLGAENLVSDVIAETSQSYDKPEKLREAANLMQVQQDLKLDQIKTSKDTEGTLEKNAKYLLESGVVDNSKDAVLAAQGKATEANDIFFEASQKLNSSKALDQTALTLGARDKFGKGIVFKNKIPKKYKGEPIEKFLESGAFRGDGLYTADGKIMLIQDGKIKSELIIRGSIEEGLFSFGGDD